MTMTEAPFSITFKNGTSQDSALVTVRGETAVEIQSRLEAIAANGLGAVLSGTVDAVRGASTVGATLGATPVNAPQVENTHQAAPQGTQGANPWATVAQQPPAEAENPWGSTDQPQQAAQPQQAGSFEGAGAPMVLGMPARKVSGTSKKTGRPWEAWADPRPKEATQHIQARTDDPNDPRLAAGQATFWKFI